MYSQWQWFVIQCWTPWICPLFNTLIQIIRAINLDVQKVLWINNYWSKCSDWKSCSCAIYMLRMLWKQFLGVYVTFKNILLWVLVCFRVHCPAGCAREAYSVYGTDMYRGVWVLWIITQPFNLVWASTMHFFLLIHDCHLFQDSNICAAAIHAGVVLNDIGGDCTLLKADGQNFYSGSTRNGIVSRQ